MIRNWSVCFLFSLISFFSLAQNTKSDTLASTRLAHHYIGIQSNQLFRQILNLSNTNSAINNPYLLTYAVNSTRNGCGFNASIGITVSDITTEDGNLKRQSNINDFFIRMGFEKKSSLGKKWIVSWAIDAIFEQQNDVTTATTDFGNNNGSSKTKTDDSNKAGGLGPRFTLNYKVTDRILIGTESSYYFKSGKNSSEVTSSQTFNNQTTAQETVKNSDKTKSFQLALPVALYLIVKF